MQCVTSGEKGSFEEMVFKRVRLEKDLNDLAEIHCSRKTMYNIKKKCELLEEEVQPKNAGRISAFNNLRTPLSFCCLLNKL